MPKKTAVLHIEQFHDSHSHEDFYVNTMQEHLQTRHKDIALPHSHDFYLAMLFTKGNGFHEIDFTTYAVKPGTLFFLNPGQTHHWELSEDTEGYIFFHTQEFYDLYYTHNRINRFPFFYSMHQSPVIYCDALAENTIERLFKWILEENSNDKLLKKEALTSLIDLVYTESSRIYQQQNPAITDSHNGYYTKFREFEALVERHFRELKLPSAYASLLAMTSRHLNRITQSVIGKTAGDVIMDRVLLEAKKLLVLQRESFNEIAHSLGYEDYAYFSRLFKNKTGETPSEFLGRYGKR
ncbi:AraC family transcriptional regulator [Flavobacterium album]|nr:helix-turn-helix transcriptional regulator [Flavobacterium album]